MGGCANWITVTLKKNEHERTSILQGEYRAKTWVFPLGTKIWIAMGNADGKRNVSAKLLQLKDQSRSMNWGFTTITRSFFFSTRPTWVVQIRSLWWQLPDSKLVDYRCLLISGCIWLSGMVALWALTRFRRNVNVHPADIFKDYLTELSHKSNTETGSLVNKQPGWTIATLHNKPKGSPEKLRKRFLYPKRFW